MKDEELDRLFKQNSKLFRAEPSPQAWQQLEQQLQQKRGKRIWIYVSAVAASLLLFGGLWLSIDYSQTFMDLNSATIQQKNEKSEVAGIESEEIHQQENLQPGKEKADPLIEQQEGKETQRPKQQHSTKSRKQTAPANSTIAAQKRNTTGSTTERIALLPELPKLENKEAEAIVVADKKPNMPKTLAPIPEYTEDIIIRYSTEAEGSSELATAPETPGSAQEDKGLTARTVVGFLKKVKENGSDGLADIREVKDQILSIRMGR